MKNTQHCGTQNTLHFTTGIKKHDAWVDIVKVIGCPVVEAKKKMESLLGSYRRERAKAKSSMGTDREELYQCRWFAFESMVLIIDRDEPIPTMCSEGVSLNTTFPPERLPPTEVIEVRYPEEWESCRTVSLANSFLKDLRLPPLLHSSMAPCSHHSLFIAPKNENSIYCPFWVQADNGEDERDVTAMETVTQADNSIVEASVVITSCTKPIRLKKRARPDTGEDPRIAQAFTLMKNASDQDECDIFGKFVAKKLMQYIDRTRSISQHHIHNILFQADMGQYYANIGYFTKGVLSYTIILMLHDLGRLTGSIFTLDLSRRRRRADLLDSAAAGVEVRTTGLVVLPEVALSSLGIKMAASRHRSNLI
ncbi:hypothetical protein PR048_013063 [Dryococelus australis]|uniref:MADF domain-containing protein n=1 Tax=Dryococelus australis TaxID=614101 RepID=A0ABQ9HRY6_9NEOP|nr:hypothetical protein PR048_013063 [Dryococelus australis]